MPEKRMQVYHPKYGIVSKEYLHFYSVNNNTGEDTMIYSFSFFSNDELNTLKLTALESENYEMAVEIQCELDKRN
jgi:hypothetical protein